MRSFMYHTGFWRGRGMHLTVAIDGIDDRQLVEQAGRISWLQRH